MKKKKKFNYTDDNEFNKLNNNIKKYNNVIWCPKDEIKYEPLNTNSCFSILKKNNENEFKNIKLNNKITKQNTNIYKCLKVELIFDDFQKKIINRWFKSFILMYNETLN